MSKSAREIQEHLFDLGYIDRGNSPTLPRSIHAWMVRNGVSASELDSALSWQQGAAYRLFTSLGLPVPDGSDPGAAPPPVVEGYHPGSGILGTAAKPAPGIGGAGIHKPGEAPATPPVDPKADLLDWVDRTKFKLPGDEIAFFWEAKRRGLTHAQVEEWLGISADDRGGIDRVARERGLM